MMLVGCESVDLTSDTIEFRLPNTSDEEIAGYTVELVDPMNEDSLGIQEGLPGEILIFELDRIRNYTDAIVTALAADGSVLDSTDAMVVDLDWRSPLCVITADATRIMYSKLLPKTKYSIDVKCYALDLELDYNDQDGGRPTGGFKLWEVIDWDF